MAASEAMVVYFLMFGLFGKILFTHDNGLYAMGVLTYSAAVVFISIKLLYVGRIHAQLKSRLTHFRLLEMHSKSVVSLIGIILSIGAWFFWNLVLSSAYKNNVIYNVKGGLLSRFGQSATWWLVLILVVSSCVTLELAVASIRSTYRTTDVSTVILGTRAY